MAGFRGHTIGGVIIAGAIQFILPSDPIIRTYSAAVCIMGSVFPDIDSDRSKTVRYFFSFFTIFASILIFHNLNLRGVPLHYLLPLTVGVIFLVPLFIKPIFLKITSHRGIFHTIPMGITAALLLSEILQIGSQFYIFLSFLIGVLTHLIIDELYSITSNLKKGKLKPKKSFGTAFKWFAPSKKANIATNILMILLIIYRWDGLKLGFQTLFRSLF